MFAGNFAKIFAGKIPTTMKQLMPQFMRDSSSNDGHAEPERSKCDTKQRRTALRVKNKGEWRNVGTHGSCVRDSNNNLTPKVAIKREQKQCLH